MASVEQTRELLAVGAEDEAVSGACENRRPLTHERPVDLALLLSELLPGDKQRVTRWAGGVVSLGPVDPAGRAPLPTPALVFELGEQVELRLIDLGQRLVPVVP